MEYIIVPMLETPHVLVGAAIAANVPNPMISVPLCFASHFVLDMIPHWNPHLNTELKNHGRITKSTTRLVAADVLVGSAAGLAIASTGLPDLNRAFFILLGAFVAVLPDAVEVPYYFFRKKSKWVLSWIKFQKSIQNDTTPIWGILSQTATMAASVIWIFF